MPRPHQDSPFDLFSAAVTELDRSITLPNIKAYKPYGAQLPFHESDAFGRILTAGNRAGKTDSMVVEFIWWASDTHRYQARPSKWGVGPLQLRIIVVDVEKGVNQIMLPKFKRWMTRDMLVDGSWDKSWNQQSLTLTFANGSTIDFLTYGMTLEKHGGVPRHLIGFDEEPPREIFNEAMMRLVDFDGRWVIAATPVNGMDWIYDLLVEPAKEDPEGPVGSVVKVFELDSSQNPYLLSEDRERFLLGMDPEERRIREKGEYVARAGLVFPKLKDNKDIFVMHRDWKGMGAQIYATMDHGWKNPTAWLWIAVFPDGSAHVFGEHYLSGLTVSQHARLVLEREKAWGLDPDDIPRSGDPALKQTSGITGTSVVEAYAEEGIYINVETIPRNAAIGTDKGQEYFRIRKGADGAERSMLTIEPDCVNLWRELKKLRWATYESAKQAYQRNALEEVHKKDDHAWDALKYFLTQMPDLLPDQLVPVPRNEKDPITIPFGDLLARMRDAGETEFVDDTVDDQWEIVDSYGEVYFG